MHLEKQQGRARRRKDLARMKKRAQKLYPHDENARLANHLAACSCHMCGNPRKHFSEPTMQEKRAMQDARQQLERIALRSEHAPA